MTSNRRDGRASNRPVNVLSRLPTGAKLFLILSAALLPLALIALFASLQTNRTVDQQAAAQLRVAANEASRSLSIELVGDMTALRVAANALERDPADAPSCARVQGVFASQLAADARFAIINPGGSVLCGDMAAIAANQLTVPGHITAHILAGEGLVLSVASDNGGVTASAMFPSEMIGEVTRPSGFVPPYSAALVRGGERLELQTLTSRGPLDRMEHASAPITLDDIILEMSVRSAPITSPLLVAMLLPLLMWAAAAGIGWFVVDRLLIRPLRQLRATVGEYRPGEVIEPTRYGAIPAQEIRELGDTFRDISSTVHLHEADLAAGLVRQTKLTREVHHRVKNNLQVIASLINFHARSAGEQTAAAAYAAIQRRVDALAVVHRHHYAELEDNRGLELRSVIGELATNLRATAPDEALSMGISIDVEPLLVSQDVAVAVSFLITEIVEMAMECDPTNQTIISVRQNGEKGQALLRVESTALIEGERLRELLDMRYGRVITGLSRQLRQPIHHDAHIGSYEICIAASLSRG